MPRALWNNMLAELSRTIDAQRVNTWFRALDADPSSPAGVLSLRAPNQFICDFLQQHYQQRFLDLAQTFDSSVQQVRFSSSPQAAPLAQPLPVAPSTPPVSAQTSSESNRPAPTVPHSTLNKRFIFDSFVVGSGNEFAKSAAFAVAESPGKTKFNPLLIYGGVGLGKTHLLQAIGNYVLSFDSSSQVTYITSEEFYLTFIEAIKNNDTKSFTSRFRTSDVLLVDDIQFLSGKESTQEEFFFIFNTLYQNARQIVLTSDVPPASLQGLQDRLVSRFQWGLSVDIQPPNLEMRVAILKKKAEEGRLGLTEEVLYYIAESFSSNIRELEGAVIRLLAFASITKSDVTLETVKSVLKPAEKREKARISIEQIIDRVADFYAIPVNNFREKIRRKEVAHARQVAMYIAKCVTNHSLKSIGLNFGGRDHSTVIHAVSQIEQQKTQDSQLARQIDQIISTL
jgi:chromosomal replication initiator protein